MYLALSNLEPAQGRLGRGLCAGGNWEAKNHKRKAGQVCKTVALSMSKFRSGLELDV